MAKETTDSTFNETVLQSDKPVLVDFWAPWCGPCRMVGPIIENIAKKMNGTANVFKCNVDENPATAQKYGITSIPTVIIFKNGQILNQFVGVRTENDYVEALSAQPSP